MKEVLVTGCSDCVFRFPDPNTKYYNCRVYPNKIPRTFIHESSLYRPDTCKLEDELIQVRLRKPNETGFYIIISKQPSTEPEELDILL